MSMNSWAITGRLGQDCEVFTTKTDKIMTSFSVAVDVGWGERKHTLWVRCTAWGESAAPYLLKGKEVAVVGEADLREYDKKDGSGKGVSLEMSNCKVDLIGGTRSEGSSGGTSTGAPGPGFKSSAPAAPAAPAAAPKQAALGSDDGWADDDIPF